MIDLVPIWYKDRYCTPTSPPPTHTHTHIPRSCQNKGHGLRNFQKQNVQYQASCPVWRQVLLVCRNKTFTESCCTTHRRCWRLWQRCCGRPQMFKFSLNYLRPHYFLTLSQIWFIFCMIIHIGPKFCGFTIPTTVGHVKVTDLDFSC